MVPDQSNIKLKFPAGKFEKTIGDLIVLIEAIIGLMAILTFGFWMWLVLGSLYHPWMLKPGMFWEYFDVDWYPVVFALAIAMVILTALLHMSYEFE